MPFTTDSETPLNPMLAAEIAIICSEKLNSSARKFAVFETGPAWMPIELGWKGLACFLQPER